MFLAFRVLFRQFVKSRTGENTILFLLLLFSSSFFCTCGEQSVAKEKSAGRTRVITDIYGESIHVPAEIKRVACLDVLCYSIMITLQQDDKVISIQQNSGSSPWTDRVRHPENLPIMTTFPGVETLLKLKSDVIIGGYGGKKESAKFAAVGLIQVQAQPRDITFRNAEDFFASQKQMMRVYGQILGAKAFGRAKEWCIWYDSLVQSIRSRTDTLSPENRPRTYLVRGPSSLDTQGPSAGTFWYGEIAGGNMIVKEIPEIKNLGRCEVTMEWIIRGNPEVVLMDRQSSPKLVTDDPRWKKIRAVVDRRILPIPGGVFFWDGGPESALLLPFLAKKLHPDLFSDLNLPRTVQNYYERFYDCHLSDQETDRMLRGLDSHGNRTGIM